MNVDEFREEFDILYNNLASGKAPALDDYEISVFLTMAEEELVKSWYEGSTIESSFEENEKKRRMLDSLIKTAKITDSLQINDNISSISKFYELPDDLLYITMESVDFVDGAVCGDGTGIPVIPTSQDSYAKIKNNPFRRASKNRVLRLDAGDNIAELISPIGIKQYIIRYIRKPNPIILSDLEDGLSINNQTQKRECELDSSVHREIVNAAVILAINSFSQAR